MLKVYLDKIVRSWIERDGKFLSLSNFWVCQIFEFVKSIGAMLRSFSQLAFLAKSINKDLTVCLDGARLYPKYVFKNNIQFDQLSSYEREI